MSDRTGDRPVHVRVAEVLGWGEFRLLGADWSSDVIVKPAGSEPTWYGKKPISDEDRKRLQDAVRRGGADILKPYQTGPHGPWYTVPRFDEDWGATGPLIEKHGIATGRSWNVDSEKREFLGWLAWSYGSSLECPKVTGSTVRVAARDLLVAVCECLVAIANAGLLK